MSYECHMPTLADLPRAEAIVIAMTNAFRREHGLAALAANPALGAAARAYAAYLAAGGGFSHAADGRDPTARAEAAGYRSCSMAENLARIRSSHGIAEAALASEVIEGWKGSPAHRANLLEASATDIGVAVAAIKGTQSTYVTVELLGRPHRLMVTFSVENRTHGAIDYAVGGATHALASQGRSRHALCWPGVLRIGGRAYQVPHAGDRYVVEADRSGGVRVTLERH
jgi:hypothetical protein